MKKILALTLVALAACQRADSRQPDPALERDLALAGQAATPVPQFQDAPAPAEPAVPAPRPAPREQPRATNRIDNAPRVRQAAAQVVTPPIEQRQATEAPVMTPAPASASAPAEAPGRAMIGAGATFSLTSLQRICTTANRPGDRFVASVSNAVTGVNGAAIPAGANVVLEVASVQEPTSSSPGAINVVVHSVELNGRNHPMTGDVYTTAELEKVRLNGESDKKKVIGGAVAGALIGQMMKKDTKGTVIGAAAGAATGAAAAKMTEKWEGCMPVGAPLRLTLGSALVL